MSADQLYLVEFTGQICGVGPLARAEAHVRQLIAEIEGTTAAEVERSLTRVEHPNGEVSLMVEHHAAWLRPVQQI